MPAAALKTDVVKEVWARARRSAVLYGAFATVVRVGANIILLPLVLNLLAPPELAVWYVFLALGAFANLADFGFGPAIARVYSYLWAGAEDFETEGLGPPPQSQEPNRPRIREFHAAVRTVYWRIALVGMALLVVGGTLFLIRPIATVADPVLGWLCWVTFILSITFSLGTSHWMLACQGTNRVRELQAAHLASGLGYVLSAGLLLVAGWGLFAMVIGTAIRAVVARQMCRAAYRGAVPDAVEGSRADVSSMLKRIWPNARKFGVISIGAYLVANANVLVCSQFLGSELTASFGLTTQIANFMVSFSALWLIVKWPQITMLRTQGRLEEMAVMFARRLALTMATFAALAVVLVLFGNKALEWKGTHTRFLETPYLLVYLLHIAQQQFYAQFGTLAFTENFVPFVKLGLWTGVVLTALSVILVQVMGLWGLLLAPIISTVAASSWYVTLRGFRGQPLTVRQFARAALFRHA